MQSRGWTGILAATILVAVLEVAALPNPYAGFDLDDVRQPVYRGNTRTRESKSDTEVIVKSDIIVGGGEDGRAHPKPAPTTPTPMAESLKMVTKQLLQAPSATDMVATDVRTPPRVKSQVNKTQDAKPNFVGLGKGEAHPVAMDEASSYEIVTAGPNTKSSTPPPGGLSTWILLSNGEQSTLASKKKGATQPTAEPKRQQKPTTAIPTIEKVTKKNEAVKHTPNKPVAAALVNNTRTSPITLQDSKFKNRTPVVVGRIPAVQNKTEVPMKKISPTQPTIVTAGSLITKKKHGSSTSHTRYDIVPTTSLLLETGTVENNDDTSTTETSTTNKTTRRPTTKKKKKNKNRRRRPTKDSPTAESKVTDTGVASNKIDGARPISTRIYNYLAREVMPSVGVGIVGLVLTAGLAGLFLYPFGGGIARRNYEKGSGSMHNPHYYYNSYAPHPEEPNSQPEEKVFGQVLSNMNHNSFSPSYETKYTTSNNKFRYDMQDFGHGTVNGYAGTSDYSTLPDSVKNTDFTLKTTEFSARDPVKSTDYLPDSSKYYSMDPVSSHYKLTDSAAQVDSYKPEEPNYPSLTEYTSYSNAASVGTADSFKPIDDKNETSPGEDKSDKSQPQFSALVGSPQFTNTDFVGSVSLTGSYGAQEVRHRTGVLAAEHGPRSLTKPEAKERNKRDVHDDFSNEIDGSIPVKDNIPFASSTTETTTKYDESTEKDILTTVVDETTQGTVQPTEDSISPGTVADDGGFIGFLTRLAQVKLKIGISLLRTTGEALQKYMDVVAKRMEAAVRTIEANQQLQSRNRSTHK